MTSSARLDLFQGFGVELEYMIVDRTTLDVLPCCDRLIHDMVGRYDAEIEVGELCWSNELVLHVVELKTNGPVRSLAGIHNIFQQHIEEINRRLESIGGDDDSVLSGRLMPTAMHPWMNPNTEMKLWPHEYSAVYELFNRIFDCRGHGWANLQSTHLNLPFDGDEQFAALHAAVRLVLPILPGLAASSPVFGSVAGTHRDNRLEVYRHNARRIPEVSGRVIPEPVFSRSDYETRIFRPMYEAIAPHDPQGILQHEWLNARGAIARFDRGAIEIRVLDIQECPLADIAVLSAITAVIRALTNEEWCDRQWQQHWPIDLLEPIFLTTVRDGEEAVIDDAAYLRCFGIEGESSLSLAEMWSHLFDTAVANDAEFSPDYEQPLRTIIRHGTLATRILRALGPQPDHEAMHAVYGRLCDCLRDGTVFTA